MSQAKPGAARKAWRDVDGVLLLDKPAGPSSNAALQRARRVFAARKAGHGGTLDPLASGLLPVCFGEATKFSAMLLEADKSYRAVIRLGVRTTTGDAEGEILETRPVDISSERILAVLEHFTGEIDQVPPMYSALKRDGRPLYELARRGESVDLPPRKVVVSRIAPLHWQGDQLEIEVDCSKGTYIRVLAEDIGTALGCGASLAALQRTRIGVLHLRDAIGLERLEAPDADATGLLLPVDAALSAWPVVRLDDDEGARLLQGRRIATSAGHREGVRVYTGERFLGIADIVDGMLVPRRLVGTGPENRLNTGNLRDIMRFSKRQKSNRNGTSNCREGAKIVATYQRVQGDTVRRKYRSHC